MRDRRNTNLSISSIASNSSYSPISPVKIEDTEKGRFLWLPAQPVNTDLPSPLIKHEREIKKSWMAYCKSKLASRPVVAVTIIFILCLGYSLSLLRNDLIGDHDLQHFAIAEGNSLTDKPGPVIVQDGKGRKRWTMNVPDKSSFPLRPAQYRDMCRRAGEVSEAVRDLNMRNSRVVSKAVMATHRDSYYATDRAFMDVHEAEEAGLVPSSTEQRPIATVGRSNDTATHDMQTCDRSMTFVLETEDAGFGHSLLMLWMTYGLAKKEGRAFFVDDTRWQYGNYLTYFPSPPQSNCLPPQPSKMVPCPHQAKHLVVSAATAPWTFGDKFHQHFQSNIRTGIKRQRQIYDLVRAGYNDLFAINTDDKPYFDEQMTSLMENRNGPLIGMHIRRGDRHPYELEFSNDYLPLDRFTSTAISMLTSSHSTTPLNTTLPYPSLLLASDDPDIILSPSLLSTLPTDPKITLQRTQERIILASKRTLAPSIPERNGAYTKHVDENSGWEGGFFAPLFRSLGHAGRAAHPSFHSAKEMKEGLEMRVMQKALEEAERDGNGDWEDRAKGVKQLVGRAWLLDMAVLSKADGVVCASSSASCRVLGVMMGWDAVVGDDGKGREGRWRNVDDGRVWSWDGRR